MFLTVNRTSNVRTDTKKETSAPPELLASRRQLCASSTAISCGCQPSIDTANTLLTERTVSSVADCVHANLREIANGVDRAIGIPLPVAVEYSFENIPEELRTCCSWMPFRFAANRCWIRGDLHAWSKLPVNPHTGAAGSITNPDSWGSFEEALGYYAAHALDEDPRTVAHGLGFVVREPYVVCDIDDHVTTGLIDDWALGIAKRLDTYCELSVSGTGLHLVLRASVDSDRCRYPGGLEVYCHDRYMTATGIGLPGHTAIGSRGPELRMLCAELRQAQPATLREGVQNRNYNHTSAATGSQPSAAGPHGVVRDFAPCLLLSEEAVLAKILRDPKAAHLWRGDPLRYASKSEADAALVEKLLFYSGLDAQLTDRLFRRSGLFRPKWDRACGTTTYGAHTIANVLGWMQQTGIARAHPGRPASRGRRGRPRSENLLAAVRLLSENPRLKPAELARTIGQNRNYAKQLIQRAKRLTGTTLEGVSTGVASPVTGTRARVVRRRRLKAPAFASFWKLTRRASEYRPARRVLELLFSTVCRYAARQGFRLRVRDLRAWWKAMLDWRRWASANPERRKRFVRRSRGEFVDYAVKAIDSHAPSSPFRRFLGLLRTYYRTISWYPPPFSALLRAFLDFMDVCDSAGIEQVEMDRVEIILNRVAARDKPPRTVPVLLASIQEALVSPMAPNKS